LRGQWHFFAIFREDCAFRARAERRAIFGGESSGQSIRPALTDWLRHIGFLPVWQEEAGIPAERPVSQTLDPKRLKNRHTWRHVACFHTIRNDAAH
jgi:hypothetical protein